MDTTGERGKTTSVYKESEWERDEMRSREISTNVIAWDKDLFVATAMTGSSATSLKKPKPKF